MPETLARQFVKSEENCCPASTHEPIYILLDLKLHIEDAIFYTPGRRLTLFAPRPGVRLPKGDKDNPGSVLGPPRARPTWLLMWGLGPRNMEIPGASRAMHGVDRTRLGRDAARNFWLRALAGVLPLGDLPVGGGMWALRPPNCPPF